MFMFRFMITFAWGFIMGEAHLLGIASNVGSYLAMALSNVGRVSTFF
jgi:hypothetical protein